MVSRRAAVLRGRRLIIRITATLVLAAGSSVSAQSTFTWAGGNGNWSDANWKTGQLLTTWADNNSASISANTTGLYTVTVDQNVNANQITLDATVNQPLFSVVAAGVIEGQYALGSWNLSGGSLNAGYLYQGIYGTGDVTVSGGSLDATNLFVGYNNGTGHFSLVNGNVSAVALDLGYFQGVGNLQVSGGALSSSSFLIGNTGSLGSINLSGGSLTVTGTTTLSASGGIGTFLSQGGSLTATNLQVNGLGIMALNDATSPATLNFSSLVLGNAGALLVVPYHGHVDSTEAIFTTVNPATNNGLVGATAFVQTSANGSADFLSAVPTFGTFRLVPATVANAYNDVNFSAPTPTSVELVTGPVSLQSNTSVYALNLGSGSATIGSAISLQVAGGGVIVDGGTIAGGSLLFGSAVAVIYSGPTGISTITSDVSGSNGLVKLGPGTLSLSKADNLSGQIIVGGGTLSFGPSAGLAATFTRLALVPGNTATLQLGGNTLTTSSITVSGPDSVIENASNTPGTLVATSDAVFGSFLGVLQDGPGQGSLSVVKDGGSTFTLSPPVAEAYTGSTVIKNGELRLDFTNATAASTNLLNSQSILVMGGGNPVITTPTLRILGKASGITSQTFAGTILQPGLAVIARTQGVVNVYLGGITRYAGGVIDFGKTNGASVFTSQPNDGSTGATTSSGIIGGYAVIGSDWAVGMGTGASIAPYGDYITTGIPVSGTTTGNYAIATNPAELAGDVQVNSLKITGGTAMNLGGYTLSVASGGLMFTGGSYIISNGQLGANSDELIIWQNASSTVTVNAPIGNLTFSPKIGPVDVRES
jgi:autotransporter-associated beta strand protein